VSKIAELLDIHSGKLDPKDRSILKNLCDKTRRKMKYAWPGGTGNDNRDDHMGFAKIERVFSPEPVDLFGQEVGALSFNKLTISRSDEEDADSIIEIHLSDQALTNLMLASNTGMHSIPGTVNSIGGQAIPPYRAGEASSDASFRKERNAVRDDLLEKLSDLTKSLNKATNARARKEAQSDIDRVRKVLKNSGELSFFLDQRMESYSAKRIDLISEVSQAAFHAEHVLDAPLLLTHEDSAFDPEIDRFENPMMNSLLGEWTSAESGAVAHLVLLEIDRISDEYNVDLSRMINQDGQMVSGRDLPTRDPECRKALEDIRSLVNGSLNIHVLEGRQQRQIHQVGMSLTRYQGNGGYTHSALPSRSQNMFTFSIGAAYEEQRFGESKIRGASDELVAIEMTADDLMMMFRGTMSGAPVPCAVKTIAGYGKNMPDPEPHTLRAPMDDVLRNSHEDDRRKQCLALLRAAEELLAGSAKRGDLEQLSAQLEEIAPYLSDFIEEGFNAGDQVIKETVADVVREDFEEIHKANPDLFEEVRDLMMIEGHTSRTPTDDDGFAP